MAAIVQWLERLIVVQDVEGSNPSSRPISFPLFNLSTRFQRQYNASGKIRSQRIVMSLKAVILLAFVLVSAMSAAAQNAKNYVPDELLVKFADSSDFERSADILTRSGVAVKQKFASLGWQLVRIRAGESRQQVEKRLRAMPAIEAVQPNYYYHLLATPNDPRFPESGMWGLTKISAPAAWDVFTGSPAVVVANIDTGMRYTHEDLAANAWTNSGEINGNGVDDDGNGFVDDYYGYDFRYNDPDPADQHGHGTHTAGTIGAAGNNGIGVAGVNWNVKLMTIKIYSAAATDTTSAMLINAYNYVTLMKNRGVNIRVTNNSYGGCSEACGYDQATKDALDAMGNAGILNVFAAGNDGRNTDNLPAYPASYTSPSIISVANSTSSDARSGSSNWGVTTVDLAAPGSGILSTTNSSNTSYGSSSGTSMASPHVAGAAALLAGLNPSLSAASLKASILNNVDLLTQWNGMVKTGGRLNVAAALADPTVCTVGISSNAMAVPTKGGYFSVNVTTPANCDHFVKSDSRWIRVEGGEVLSGSRTLTFRVLLNTAISRSGTITIGGQNITITQSRK